MFAVEDRPLERPFRHGPITDRQKVAICLKFMRATQYNNRVLIRRCILFLPVLAQFFDSEGESYSDDAAFRKYLQGVCSDILHAEISDFFAEDPRASRADSRPSELRDLLRLGLPQRRRLT
eukprot:9488522-Pyramimonas_sp.AAC.1